MDVKRPHYIELPIRAKWWIFSYWKTQAFEFNMAAWFAVYERFDWNFETIKSLPPEEVSVLMVYEAARQGNFVNGKPFKVPMVKFLNWAGNMRASDNEALKKVFVQSAHVIPETMQKFGAGASKKK